MPSEKNIQSVQELTEKLSKAKSIYFTDYLGLNVENITQLRAELYKESIEFHVAKNRLIKLAADEVKIKGIDEFLTGPTALAISYDEPTAPARVLKKFKKDNEKPTIKGILFEGEILKGEEFKRIANLPSKNQLMATLAAMLMSPLTKFVSMLNSPMSDLAGALNSLKQKK
ncbi:MAG: 50S ribosomal protein L10 [Candidatus Neomarinimicrobiota bacterium]